MEDFTVREGTVVAIERDMAVVRIEREEDCGGCRSCAMKALCRGRDTGHMDLVASLAGGAAPSPGTRVQVAYRETNPALAALVMFVPSLLGLFFGGFAANRLWHASDGIFLAGCLVGLLAGLAATFVLYRLSSALKPAARLVDGESAV